MPVQKARNLRSQPQARSTRPRRSSIAGAYGTAPMRSAFVMNAAGSIAGTNWPCAPSNDDALTSTTIAHFACSSHTPSPSRSPPAPARHTYRDRSDRSAHVARAPSITEFLAACACSVNSRSEFNRSLGLFAPRAETESITHFAYSQHTPRPSPSPVVPARKTLHHRATRHLRLFAAPSITEPPGLFAWSEHPQSPIRSPISPIRNTELPCCARSDGSSRRARPTHRDRHRSTRAPSSARQR